MSWFRDSGLTKRKKIFISPQNAYLQEVNVVPSLAFKMTLTSPSRTSKKRVLSSIFFTILFPLHGLFFTRVMTTKCILTLIFGDSTNWYDPFASRQLRSWVPSGTRSCCPHTFTDAPNILMMLLSNHACGKQSVAHGLSNGTQENYLFYSIARSHRWTRTRAAQLILWYMSLLERVYLFHSLIIVQPLPDIPRNCQSMQQCDSHIQGLSMSQCVLDTSTYLFGLVHNLVNVMSRIDRRTCMPWMMDHLPPDVSKCTAWRSFARGPSSSKQTQIKL